MTSPSPPAPGANRPPVWPGVPLALASAILFGATPPLAKMLIGTLHPIMTAGLFYLGAGVGLALFRALKRRRPGAPPAPLSGEEKAWLAAAILCGGGVAPGLLMLGLSRASASSASLLLNLEGLFTMALAWLVWREHVDRRLLLGAAAILSGAALLSWGGGVTFDGGALLVAAACLAWGLDNNFTRNVSAADPVTIAMAKGLIAGPANIAIAIAAGAALPPAGAGTAAAAIGFFGVGVSLVLFVFALRHLGAARTGAYYSVAPFVGATLAVLFLGETVTTRIALAGLLMAFGVWLHLTEDHEHEHEHDWLEHEHEHVHDEHHRHDHDGPATEPHSHRHTHAPMRHRHAHFPDIHHRHDH